MEMRMDLITRYFGSFKQRTLKVMLLACLQLPFFFVPALALAQLPTVNLTLDDGAASEAGPDPGSFIVTRTGSTTGALLVRVDVTGTANIGNDYLNPDMVWLGGPLGTFYGVTIQPGQLTETIIIMPIQDGIIEDDEKAIFTLLGDGVSYTVGPEAEAVVTILDDVPEVTVTLNDGAAAEAGPDPGSITVNRSDNGIVAEALLVRVDVTGTANIGNDYLNPDMVWLGGPLGTFYGVTIQPGQLTETIIIMPIQDGIIEDDETAIFTLLGDGVSYTVGEPAHASITIADYVEGIFKDGFEDL